MTGKLSRAAELQLILKYESEGCAHKKRRRNEKPTLRTDIGHC